MVGSGRQIIIFKIIGKIYQAVAQSGRPNSGRGKPRGSHKGSPEKGSPLVLFEK